MKKVWLHRDHVYNHKPFYKQKLKVLIFVFVIFCCVYFGYQIFYLNKLIINSMETTQILVVDTPEDVNFDSINSNKQQASHQENSNKNQQEDSSSSQYVIPRGIRLRDLEQYSNKYTKFFKCFKSGKEIPFERVNDNYCDCEEDGSDEPATNACAKGVFYCKYQHRHHTGRGAYISIPSSRVNDGICDCCDTSDEWLSDIQCPNTCK
uniref:CSON004288 protein n=1 Tax=Culicoides sonorensis TaxID=179676 RepID=A0A336MNI4_CULSO